MKKVFCLAFAILFALSMASCTDMDTEGDPSGSAVVHTLPADGAAFPVISSSEVVLGEADVDLLTQLVVFEAGGFPYMTQVCFAAMVLNRVEDPYFPRGLRGVVFESGDFSSVLSGKVTGTLPEGFESTRKFRIAKKAVEEALGGLDPTDGALYFSTAARKSAAFTPSFECGGMSFGF